MGHKSKRRRARRRRMQNPRPATLPKICGADIELGNFISGVNSAYGTGNDASIALLREIPGVSRTRDWGGGSLYASPHAGTTGGGWGTLGNVVQPGWGMAKSSSYNPQDRDRKFLPANGGCAYIDLDHLELCIPEVRSARDHVAAWHAMLRIARNALGQANERQPEGREIEVLVNNSDGLDHSYGSHLNFLVTRQCWDNIFSRRLHYLLFLASYQASSIVCTGAGKVGSENRRPAVDYQISSRADFFETITGEQTTYHRPLVNSRDESLCGTWRGNGAGLARIHSIFFDSTLAHYSCFLRVGVMQLVLAMIEQEQADPRLILEDPVGAVQRWSHDPDLGRQERLVTGGRRTAVELQHAFHERAQRFVSQGRARDIVPDAEEILRIWGETLSLLRQGDFDALAPRLDWVLKRQILGSAVQRRPELTWDSPEMKMLDLNYGNLDPAKGLYLILEQEGGVEKLVSDSDVERFQHGAPTDTRAWLRANLLQRLPRNSIHEVDWDRLVMKVSEVREGWKQPARYVLPMEDPRHFTRETCEPLFEEAGSLEEVLLALGLREENAVSSQTAGHPVNGPAESECRALQPYEGPGNGRNGGNHPNSEQEEKWIPPQVDPCRKNRNNGGQNDVE